MLAPTETHAARVLSWWTHLDMLGVGLPLVIVHDLGLSLAYPDEGLMFAPRCPCSGADAATGGALARLIADVRDTLVRRALVALRPSDEVVAAVLASLLAHYDTAGDFARIDASDLVASPHTLQQCWAKAERGGVRVDIDAVTSDAVGLLTRLDALDVDTLRLASLMGNDGVASLVTALGEPHGDLISRMTLEVLPSVLENRPKRGAAAGVFGGVEGLGTRGDLDSLLSSELAWDDDELVRRLLFDEALHLTRQETSPPEAVHHVIVVDATAAMRGDRAIFARALSLALAKKHHLAGDAVTIRFFDARLYEPIAVGDALPVADVVGFQGEDGRNVARVLDALVTEVEAMQRRSPRRVVVHLVTHGATVAPRDTVVRLMRSAAVSVTLVSPRGGSDPGFLDVVSAYATVTASDVSDPTRRAARAVELLASSRRPEGGDPGTVASLQAGRRA